MKIALLHFDLANGSRELNKKKLLQGVKEASAHGSDWIVTPETAWDGYFFYKNDTTAPEKMSIRKQKDFQEFFEVTGQKQITLFLSAAEKTKDEKIYNSCFLLTPDGKEMGVHRKMHSHQSGAEAWISLGEEAKVYSLSGIKTGLLVCADAYYEDSCGMLKKGGAELILVSAAWPPGECCKDPVSVWKRTSLWTDCPVCVCNQTGAHRQMDMTMAKSAVVDQGNCLFSYHGDPAILLWSFDEKLKKVVSDDFEIIPFKETPV